MLSIDLKKTFSAFDCVSLLRIVFAAVSTLLNSVISSANNIDLDCKVEEKIFVYIKSNNDPRTYLCGSLCLIKLLSDIFSFTL